MAIKKWILIDIANRIYCDELTIGPETLSGKASACTVTKRRLRGGLSDGVDAVRVTNGELSFDVLPTRGMSLWSAIAVLQNGVQPMVFDQPQAGWCAP